MGPYETRNQKNKTLFENSFVVSFVARFIVVNVCICDDQLNFEYIPNVNTRYSGLNFNDPSIVPDFRVGVDTAHCSSFNVHVQCSIFQPKYYL